MKTDSFYIRALLALVAFAILVTFLFRKPKHLESDPWQASSYNPAPSGTKALYLTLRQLHWPVARWKVSYRNLKGTHQVLIIAKNHLGHYQNWTSTEYHHLLTWIEQGNHVFLLTSRLHGSDTHSFLKTLGFAVIDPPNSPPFFFRGGKELLGLQRPSLLLLPGPGTPSSSPQPLIQTQSQPLPPPPSHATILWQYHGEPYIVTIPRGKGTLTLATSPSLIDNEFLQQKANLNFVLKFLQPHQRLPSKVWFDEVHHGYLETYPIKDLLKEPGVRLAGGQLLLGLLIFLSSQLYRFGPILPLHRDQARGTTEFIHSMAQLYQRADSRNATLKYLFDQTHQRILYRLELPPTSSHQLIAQRLKELYPHLPSWKKLAQRFDSQKYIQGLPPGGWLKVAQDLIQIKQEIA